MHAGEKVLTIHHNKYKIQLTASDILFMKGFGNYTYIHTTGGKCHLFSNTMKHALGVLGCSFLRIHKSYCVNPVYFVQFVGTDRVILTGGQELPVARRRIAHVPQMLEILSRVEQDSDLVALN